MAFDLTKAAGLDKIVSNLDTMEIVMIPLDLIDANEKNFFSVDDVQDLAESIQVNGILQPLNLVRAGDRYRIIAGHRRFKAAGLAGLKEVPAIILPEMSEAMERLALIQTNSTARELSYSEKMACARELKEILVHLKDEGVKLPGRLRDIMAEQLEISRSELARMNVIENNLSAKWRKVLDEKRITASIAYELAKLPGCDQEEIYQTCKDDGYNCLGMGYIKKFYDRKACADWLAEDCPVASGFAAENNKRKGKKNPCTGFSKVLKRKQAKDSDACCGCCAKCGFWSDCKFCCADAKRNREAEQRKIEHDNLNRQRETAFQQLCLRGIGSRLQTLMDEAAMNCNSLETICAKIAETALLQPNFKYNLTSYKIACILNAKSLYDLPDFISALFVLCDALECTPNELMGYVADTPVDRPSMSGWNDFSEFDPPNGEKVIVRREANGMTHCGEYIFRDGQWYNPGLDDFAMNLTGITHWILAP